MLSCGIVVRPEWLLFIDHDFHLKPSIFSSPFYYILLVNISLRDYIKVDTCSTVAIMQMYLWINALK